MLSLFFAHLPISILATQLITALFTKFVLLHYIDYEKRCINVTGLKKFFKYKMIFVCLL